MSLGCRQVADDDRPVVTVSIPPQAFLMQQIVGSEMVVNTLLPAGADPENFEPSMRAMKALEASSDYIMVGTLPFEEVLSANLKTMYPDLRISKSVLAPHHHEHQEPAPFHDIAHHHSHEDGDDPHVWTTPANLQVMADSLLSAAIRVNPEGASEYMRNHALLSKRISVLQSAMSANLAALKNRDVVIWHPSLTHMARDFGFYQLSVQQGHKEATPRQMAMAIEEAKEHHAVAFVIEKEHSPHMAEALNADMKLPVVRVSLMQPDILSSLLNLSKQLGDAAH